MELDARVIDLEELEQEVEHHLSSRDLFMGLGLKPELHAPDDADTEWLPR